MYIIQYVKDFLHLIKNKYVHNHPSGYETHAGSSILN